MNKITNYKFNKHNLRLSLSDYWDFNLAFDDIYTHTINGCLPAVFFDFNNKNTYPNKDFNVKTIKSLVTWEGAINSGATLNTFGLTGLDNGLINLERINNDYSNLALLSALTQSQIVIPSGDTKLILNSVTGYTSDVIYPIDIISGATSADTTYAQFCGGFYQGYYKLDGYDYELLPTRVNDAWTAEFYINKQELCDKYTGTTLNDLYPNNKGIFFYMGTRAENKFWNTWEGADTGCTKDCTIPDGCTDILSDWCTIPKEDEVYFVGDYGIPIPLSPPQLDIELIKNQFLIYGRSKCHPYEELSGYTGQFFKKVDDGFELLDLGQIIPREFKSNENNISINDNSPASVYPITFEVSGLTGVINSVKLSITGLTHTYFGDVAIVLVSPNNLKYTVITGRDANSQVLLDKNITISSDSDIEWNYTTGDTFINKSFVTVDLNFDLPFPLTISSGIHPNIKTFLDLTAEELNGTWSLYVQDFSDSGGVGSITDLAIIIDEIIKDETIIYPYGGNGCNTCSKCGTIHDGLGNQTVCTYDGDGLVKVTEQQRRYDDTNPFLVYGRANGKGSCNCPEHQTDEYGKVTVCSYTGATGPIEEYDYNLDIVDNALAFIIKDDGSIGYRLLTYTADCVNNVYVSGVTVEEKFSDAGIIQDNKWTYLVIKFITDYKDDCELKIAKQRKGRLLFYVDSKLKFVVDEFDEFIARRLNEYKDKQLGVPFNFSLGGGSQGLFETLTFDGIDFNDINLPIQENFAGSFIGGIQSFKFSPCRVPYEDIVANYNAMNINTSIMKSPSGYYHGKFTGSSITYENIVGLTFTLDTQIVNNTIKLPISSPSYGYVIIPMEFVQPSEFRNSNEGCVGFLIPMLTLGTIIIPDENGFEVKYIIYRTFNRTSGLLDIWFCD